VTQVAKVATFSKPHPEIANVLVNGIDGVTRYAYDLITQEDFDAYNPVNFQYLGEPITANYGLLVPLGVSHPKLGRISVFINYIGIGTKLRRWLWLHHNYSQALSCAFY
jgi:mevalonate kinase